MFSHIFCFTVPPELAKVVDISCNDCEQPSINCRWHILGVQCKNCNSFNTVVDQVRLTGEEAVAFLENMEENDYAQEEENDDDGEMWSSEEGEIIQEEVNANHMMEYSTDVARGMDLSDNDNMPSSDRNMQVEQNIPNNMNNEAGDDDDSSDEIYIPPQWNSSDDQPDSNGVTNENHIEAASASDDGEESEDIYIPRRWRFDIPVGGTKRSID